MKSFLCHDKKILRFFSALGKPSSENSHCSIKIHQNKLKYPLIPKLIEKQIVTGAKFLCEFLLLGKMAYFGYPL